MFKIKYLHQKVWRSLIIWLLGSVLFSGSLTAQASVEHEQAVQLARNGQAALAITKLTALLKTDPDVNVRYDLAVVMTWAKQDREAIALWNQLGRPTNSPLYFRTAIIEAYLNTDEIKQALALGELGIQNEPNDAQSWLSVALINMRRGERLTALRYYFMAQKLAPDDIKIKEGILNTEKVSAWQHKSVQLFSRIPLGQF